MVTNLIDPGVSSLADLTHDKFCDSWQRNARELMQRNGQDFTFPGGGDNIKHNPLLKASLEQIRDCYFTLLSKKLSYLKSTYHLEEAAKVPHQSRRQQLEFSARAQQLHDNEIRSLDMQIIMHGAQSRRRLMQPDYGFSPEEKAAIIAKAEREDPQTLKEFPVLEAANATRLLGKTIECTINSMYEVYQHPSFSHILVPAQLSDKHITGDRWQCKHKAEREEATTKDGATVSLPS